MVKVVPPTDKVMESADGSITVGPEKLYVTLWGFAAASPLVRLAKGACSRIAAMRFFSIKSFEMLLSLPVVTSAEKLQKRCWLAVLMHNGLLLQLLSDHQKKKHSYQPRY